MPIAAPQHARRRVPLAFAAAAAALALAACSGTAPAGDGALPEELHLVVGVGFLGGYTTFSTASLETVRLLQERRWLLGALNGLGVVVAATLAAGIGMGIASLVPGR